ncbi:hypothetical protein [Aureispira sp. CCB-E]|uniref:tetratricopeptide repeat protein n=1 Tax=Aureispira sp. CCB-E TaxID=3051121 RepID=UPI0028685E15|nr:hypothetical protein [Aureispira sp. CCB-E]WMX17565.1 hypothetical protein QP953_28515 [Aureispira sp. CCB-E]
MATGKALFDLIKTLSPSEKRSFTLNNRLQKKNEKDGKKTYYNEIFNILYELGDYNKEEILARLIDQIGNDLLKTDPKSILRHSENYLYEKLIETLKTSYANKSISIQLQDLILEAQILDERGLHLKAISVFKKAENLALKYHKNTFLLEILPQKAAAIVALEKKDIKEQIDAVYQMAHVAANTLKEEMAYRHENIKLTTIFRTKNEQKKSDQFISNEIRDTYAKTESKDFPIHGSFFSQYYYYNILALSAHLQKKLQLAIEHQKKAIEIWNQHPHIIEKDASSYMTQLANLINYHICAKEFVEAEAIIEKLETVKIPQKNTDAKGEQFQNVYFYRQMLYLNQKKYPAALELIQGIEGGLKKYKNKINESRKVAFFYNIGLIYLLNNDFDKALHWLQKISRSTRFNEHRPKLVRSARLLQLAIFYELESSKVVDNLSRNIKDNKKNTISIFEDILLKFFDQLNKCVPSSKKEKEIFAHFQEALKGLEDKEVIGYEAYCHWVEGHLNPIKDKYDWSN